MDNSAVNSNAIINAAAVWFVLKAIEVIAFVGYDTFKAVVRLILGRNNSDSNLPDGRRVRMEYAFSGAAFLKLNRCRGKRKWLVLFSTVVPLVVFVLELMSLILGHERGTCVTSTDLNVVQSPALVLFGDGERHGNLSTIVQQVGLVGPRATIQPCISWSSRQAGVEYLSSICAEITAGAEHAFIAGDDDLFSSPPPIGLFISKFPFAEYHFRLFAFAMKENKTERLEGIRIGTVPFTSVVVVNGKNVLYQDATYATNITKEHQSQLIQDLRAFEKVASNGQVHGTYVEDQNTFGFIWDNFEDYLAVGSKAIVYAVLAQSTRDPIKSAMDMSRLNSQDSLPGTFDILCEDVFYLPRTAGIVIIVVAVVIRLLLIFVPSKSAVELVLEESEE